MDISKVISVTNYRKESDMENYDKFKSECKNEIISLSNDRELADLSNSWLREASLYKYTYHFEWMGRPIIQLPQDVIALQEIIWATKPDVIIETGIAHGGSLILNASLLALLDLIDMESEKTERIPRKVIGIDIDIRPHNRKAIVEHPMSSRIDLIEGSSTDDLVIDQIRKKIHRGSRVMVILDSDHTEAHVLKELELYSGFVSKDCYLVVFDTVVEFLDPESFSNRDWGKGDNPWTAVQKFLASNSHFKNNKEIEDKLLITVAPGGYLIRIK